MAISTDAEKVRALVGDRDSDDYLLEDDEVDYALSVQASDVVLAAVMCCDLILAKYARYTTFSAGRSKEWQEQLLEHYRQVKTDLKGVISRGEQSSLFIGGYLEDEIDEDEEDTSLVQPTFKVGVHDHES